VQRLTFHLRGMQRVCFKDTTHLDRVLSANRERNTMFMAWKEANKRYHAGRSLNYTNFPTMFIYDSDNHVWNPRKKGKSGGRLTFVPQRTRELYYMRLLLNVQVGCTSFEDIRTVDGQVFDSYHEACGALGLLANDREFIDAIIEMALICSRYYVRRTFARLLLCCSLSDPRNVWDQAWEMLADGIVYERRWLLNSLGNVFSYLKKFLYCLTVNYVIGLNLKLSL
jgi:hypothetical protein